MLALTVDTAPALEPVTEAEVREHLRIPPGGETALLTRLISTARQWVEEYLSRALITQTLVYRLDAWPDGPIVVPRPTLQSVTSIVYVNATGTETTWSASEYQVDVSSEPARIQPVPTKSYPSVRSQLHAVRVTYVAGYGDARADIPEPIRQAILLKISDLYTQRGSVHVSALRYDERAALNLLEPYRSYWRW